MLMDLYIETLTGAAFELRVSPFETILSVKAKIQRQEGISLGQQHIIWKEHELNDEVSLHEAGVPCGGTLRLVLGMRGGPINTRRVSVEPPSWSDEASGHSIADIMWPGSSDKQVTLLVLREGDQFNFFRVMDRGDGTLTPVAETVSTGSKRGSRDAGDEDPKGFSGNDDDSADESNSSATRHDKSVGNGFRSKRLMENSLTSGSRLHPSTSLYSHKNTTTGAFNHHEDNDTSSNHSLHLKMRLLQQKMDYMRLNRSTVSGDSRRKLAPLLPSTSKEVVDKTSSPCSSRLNSSQPHASALASTDRNRISPNSRKQEHGYTANSIGTNDTKVVDSVGSDELTVPLTSSSVSCKFRSLHHTITSLPSKLTHCSLSSWKSNPNAASPSTSSRLLAGRPDQLPPVLLTARHNGNVGMSTFVTRPQRCFHCQKKTGLANTYQCRCGNNFCTRHRYAETHDCPYDYKAEGRKLIEEANPVIKASKLPKI